MVSKRQFQRLATDISLVIEIPAQIRIFLTMGNFQCIESLTDNTKLMLRPPHGTMIEFVRKGCPQFPIHNVIWSVMKFV